MITYSVFLKMNGTYKIVHKTSSAVLLNKHMLNLSLIHSQTLEIVFNRKIMVMLSRQEQQHRAVIRIAAGEMEKGSCVSLYSIRLTP